MRTLELEIEINETPFYVTVDYEYYAGEPEVWTYSNGDPGHPGSGPEVDILSIQDDFGNTVPDNLITQKWVDFIIEKCLEDAESEE
ncbi:MAG TPA: hypothetical protein VL443_27875 [Cyclobacteriaceae bacterium]|nr:hypothetical protein [Cyclobacteriaceae bacterium]